MQEHLDRQCLGSPLLEEMSVDAIVKRILINQGTIAKGSKAALLEAVELDVKTMIALANARDEELSTTESQRRNLEIAAIADDKANNGDAVTVCVAQQVDDEQDQNDEVGQGGRRQSTVGDQRTSRYDMHDRIVSYKVTSNNVYICTSRRRSSAYRVLPVTTSDEQDNELEAWRGHDGHVVCSSQRSSRQLAFK